MLKNIIKSTLEIIKPLSVTKKQKVETIAKKLTAIAVVKGQLTEMEKACRKLLKAKGFDYEIIVPETDRKVCPETQDNRSFDVWPIALAFSKNKKMRKFVDLVKIESGKFDKVLKDEAELLKIIDENTTIKVIDKIVVRELSKDDKVELKTA